MKTEQIVELIKQQDGFWYAPLTGDEGCEFEIPELVKFAKAIAAMQRETDAGICDVAEFNGQGAHACAKAIRNQK